MGESSASYKNSNIVTVFLKQRLNRTCRTESETPAERKVATMKFVRRDLAWLALLLPLIAVVFKFLPHPPKIRLRYQHLVYVSRLRQSDVPECDHLL